MAALYLHRFRYTYEAENFLQGGIRLPLPYKGNEKIWGLHGLVLAFNSPADSVTFADASDAGLLLREIVDQLQAAIATLVCRVHDGVLYIVEKTPSGGVELDVGTSTAAAKFGITADITGTIYGPYDGTAPRLMYLVPTIHDDGVLICTEE
jgi:hypothetical protein